MCYIRLYNKAVSQAQKARSNEMDLVMSNFTWFSWPCFAFAPPDTENPETALFLQIFPTTTIRALYQPPHPDIVTAGTHIKACDEDKACDEGD